MKHGLYFLARENFQVLEHVCFIWCSVEEVSIQLSKSLERAVNSSSFPCTSDTKTVVFQVKTWQLKSCTVAMRLENGWLTNWTLWIISNIRTSFGRTIRCWARNHLPFYKNCILFFNKYFHLIMLVYEWQFFLILCTRASGGELLDILTRKTFTTEHEISRYIRQLLLALDHMHDYNIAHLGLTVS